MALLTPVDEIIDVIEQNHANRQAAQVSPLKKSYNEDLKPIEFNIEKAKKLLDAAGWVDTDENNIRDKIVDGEKLQFAYFTRMADCSSSGFARRHYYPYSWFVEIYKIS